MCSRSISPKIGRLAWGCVLLMFSLAVLAAGVPASAKKSSGKDKKSRLSKYEKYDKRKAKQQIQLMKKMIDQRQAAINLALVGDMGTTLTATTDVASTVTTAAINAYCNAYAVRMQTEQDQLRAWLKEWHKVSYTPKHLTLDDEDQDLLESLTGDEFTAALLDQLIGVHMRGIAYEKQVDKKGYKPELRLLADDAKAKDYQEVAQIKAWLKGFESDDEDEDEIDD